MNYRILLVEDDPEHLDINKRFLTRNGYTVLTATSGEAAIEIVRKSRADIALILMDYHLGDGRMDGATAIREIIKIDPSQQIAAFSMDYARSVTLENIRAGANDFLDKDLKKDELLNAITRYCKKYDELHRTVRIGNIEKDEKIKFISDTFMSGASDSTYSICQSVRKIAPSDATVMILGESGTGKEVIANAIHKCSQRSKGAFVATNIAGETASVIDSSLFGHKKGSFTGAIENKLGRFKLADHGTLFLDEIGDLNLDLQVKLLRVIQERQFFPVGATHPESVDVRIIAATHRNLEQMIRDGSFREDLYYRLNTIILKTAPLRERPADIEILVAQFTDEICRKNNFNRRFERKCLDVFRKYCWPGNVRELRSVVESHLIRSTSPIVEARCLDPYLFEVHCKSGPTTMDEINKLADNVKKEHLTRIISGAGTYAEAARKLKVAPNRLHYFLTKFGLGNLL